MFLCCKNYGKINTDRRKLMSLEMYMFLYGYMLVYYILRMIITSNLILYYGKIDTDRRKFMSLEIFMFFVGICVGLLHFGNDHNI